MADLNLLQIIWFALLAVLWIGYLVLEGFDFGVGMLLRIVPKNEKERRAALNTIGPHWDGNEVWVITAGGATFAAFPEWYATMFSGMYLALVVVLLCLIVRIVAIEWRKSVSSHRWQHAWDTAHIIVAWVLSILWGVAFANLVQGTPIKVGHFEGGEFVEVPADQLTGAATDPALVDNFHFIAPGENFLMQFLSLLTPFTVVGGLVTLTIFLAQGALFLSIKTTGDMSERAFGLAKKLTILDTVVTAVWALWACFGINPWLGILEWSADAAPINASGFLTLIPLAIAAVLLVATIAMTFMGKQKSAFYVHSGAIAFAVVFIWFCIAGYAMKSSVNDAYSLTLAQASATPQTHTIMIAATVVFVPIVLAYTIWSYLKFAKRINADDVPDEPNGLDLKKVRQFEVTA